MQLHSRVILGCFLCNTLRYSVSSIPMYISARAITSLATLWAAKLRACVSVQHVAFLRLLKLLHQSLRLLLSCGSLCKRCCTPATAPRPPHACYIWVLRLKS